MSAHTTLDTTAQAVLPRTLAEGYGPGAWHGADLKAAVGDVSAATAYRRPAPGRHNIAEIALHHAYYVRIVRGRLTGIAPDPFVLEGDDWFALDDESRLGWAEIAKLLETEQQKLAAVVAEIAEGRRSSPLSPSEQYDNVLGITGHAIYHAGQIQLVKKLI